MVDIKQQVLATVYKNRIKVKDFFCDYDRHVRGIITEAQFKSALTGLAGLKLNADQQNELVSHYQEADGRVNYKAFVADCDLVFTKPHLEYTPLEEVPAKPDALLNPTRFVTVPATAVSAETEEAVAALLDELRTRVKLRRILVKPIFEDAAKHAPRSVKHITASRFRRAMKMLFSDIVIPQVDLIIEKFTDEGSLVNFAAFLAYIDPPPSFDD